MDGKLFSTLIHHGKITPHLSLFLTSVFSFSSGSVKSTNWVDRVNYKGGFIKKWMVKNALVKKGLDAITLNREVIYSGTNMYSDSENEYESWLELIVHEQFHRHEIEKLGWVYWYFRYGIEALRYGYRNSPSEKRAYAIAMGDGSVMETFLKTDLGKEFISVCKDYRLEENRKKEFIEGITQKAALIINQS